MTKLSRWVRSLQAQLILWAILPVTLVIIGLAFTGVYSHQRVMQDFVIERDMLTARLIALRLEDALSRGDLSPGGEDLAAWLPITADELPGAVWIVDRDGRLIANSDGPIGSSVVSAPGVAEALRQPEGAVIVPNSPSGPLIVTYAAVRGAEWHVIIREPAQDLIGPILRFSSLGPIAAAIAAGLSVLILTFGWRTIVRPLQRLSKAASQVSWGNHALIGEDPGGVAEIGELHRTLSEMVRRLEGYQAGVLDYLDAVTKGQEEERARLARDLHDGPVQSLIALNQRIEMARHRIERNDVIGAESLLGTLREAEVDVIDDLRRTISALRPAYLEDLGFVPALEMLVEAADARSDSQVRLEVGPEPRRLPPETELAAYRITQEALSNALQHASASSITVRVTWSEQGLSLVIDDDGVGFQPAARLDAYTRGGHFGLVGLQERVRQLGGTLEIRSTPGVGTTLSVQLPDVH